MAYNTKQMSVEQIREVLVKDFGMKNEAVDSIKGKRQLALLLNSYAEDVEEDTLSEGEGAITTDGDLFTEEPEAYLKVFEPEDGNEDILPLTPSITDLGWSDYVLSKLDETEKFEGSPKVSGLRRVTELLLGRIVSSNTVVLQCPMPDNEGRATVTHEIVVRAHDEENGDDNGELTSSGAADAYHGNSDKMFAKHPVALAETRAEGRALRRLLRLHGSVVTAEEKIRPVEEFKGFNLIDESKIQGPQIQGLGFVASRIDINLEKLINKLHPGVNNINSLSNDDGIALMNTLSSYQSTGVPEDLKGYDPVWKTKFGVE